MRLVPLAVASLIGCSAHALEPGRQAVSLYGGLAAPGGDIGDRANFGFSAGGSYRHQFTTRVSGALDGEFMRFGNQEIPPNVTSGADIFSIGALLRVDASGEDRWAVPYAGLGGALNRVSRRSETPGAREDTADWKPGFVAAIGTLIPVNGQLSLGASGRLRTLAGHGFAIAGGLELSFSLASKEDAPSP